MPSTLELSGKEACLYSVQQSTLVVYPNLFPFLAPLTDDDKVIEVLHNIFIYGIKHTVGIPEA